MTIDERVLAENEALKSLILAAGERAPLGGGSPTEGDGERCEIRLPAPSSLILEGRRIRARRRLAIGAVAASLLVLAGLGVGIGGWRLPVPNLHGERRGVEPADPTPEVVHGPEVVDVIDAMDDGFVSYSTYLTESFYYRSGPAAAAGQSAPDDLSVDNRQALRSAGVDRMVTLELPTAGPSVIATWAVTKRGTGAVVRSDTLGVLDLGADGRGSWLQVRPSAEDGWLVVAMLPVGAGDVQVRVAGSRSLLPVDDTQAGIGFVCFDAEPTDDIGASCNGGPAGPVSRLRFATTDPRPQIDAVAYADEDGNLVVLGEEALVE